MRLADFALWRDRGGRFSRLRAAVLVLLVLPAFLVAGGLLMAGSGDGPAGAVALPGIGGDARPINDAIHETGRWALRLLLVTLAVTPFAYILARPRIVGVRRMLGVGACLYAVIHLTLYAIDLHFDLVRLASEIVLRFYLTIGFVALAAMVALAATSTDGMIRRLGRRWKTLHRLIYPLTALALLHAFIQSKIDVSEAVVMTGCFLWLIAWRVLDRLRWPVRRALPLALLAVAAALASAGVEALWYALATGVDPLRVAAANLDLGLFPRPAAVVLMIGLAVAIAAAVAARVAPAPRGRTGRPATERP